MFYEIAKRDDRQCMIVADISPAGSMAKFRDEYPRRFVNTGVAEQVMIGLAAECRSVACVRSRTPSQRLRCIARLR